MGHAHSGILLLKVVCAHSICFLGPVQSTGSRLELEDKEVEGLFSCQRFAIDMDRALEGPSHVQIAFVVIGYPAAAVFSRPANPACFEQYSSARISCNECV